MASESDSNRVSEISNFSMKNKVMMTSISGIVIFFIGTTLAVIMYPGYDFFDQFLSELGHRSSFEIERDDGSTDFYQKARYPEIVNGTFMLCGLLFIPFFINTVSILKPASPSKYFFWLSAIPGTIAGPLLLGVGIFDSATDLDRHVWFALNLYLSILLSTLFWAIGVRLLSNESFYKKYNNFFDYLLSAIIVFLMGVNYFNTQPPVPLLESIPIPTYQKAVAYFFMGYFGMVSLRFRKYLKSIK